MGSSLRASYFLNTAYVIVPLAFVARLFGKSRKFTAKTQDTRSIWTRPLDLLFVLYFIAAIPVAFMRGYVRGIQTNSDV